MRVIARGKTLFLTVGYPLVGELRCTKTTWNDLSRKSYSFPPLSHFLRSSIFNLLRLRKKVTSICFPILLIASAPFLAGFQYHRILKKYVDWKRVFSDTLVYLRRERGVLHRGFFSSFLRYPVPAKKEPVVTGLRGCSPAALRCHDSSNAASRHLCATSSRVCRLSLERIYVKNDRFTKVHVSSSPFASSRQFWSENSAFSFEINKFLQRLFCTKLYTYFLLSKLFFSRWIRWEKKSSRIYLFSPFQTSKLQTILLEMRKKKSSIIYLFFPLQIRWKKKKQEEANFFSIAIFQRSVRNTRVSAARSFGKIGEFAFWTERWRRSSYYLRAGLYLAGGEDFTSVVALSNVVAPSKTVCKRRCLLRGQCY